MSLRSEYSYSYVFVEEAGEYDVAVFLREDEVDAESVRYRFDVEDAAERMISDHIRFREENGDIINEEHDRRAHKADHDNQCEKDLE